MEEEDNAVVVSWTGILVTLASSLIQGLVLYVFFCCRRKKDKGKFESNDETALDLYETRHHTRKHRTPGDPFSPTWISDALGMSDEETLKCIGLDSFMYLRVLRLGVSICALGSLFAVVLLMPVYATGSNRGNDTIQFNRLTLARVESGTNWRLWVTLGAWWVFVSVVLYLFWMEWKLFYKNRQDFLARGDVDMLPESRYTVRIEQVGKNSDTFLYNYFERLFPGKIVYATSCLQTKDLESLVATRKNAILKLESLEAAARADPSKPPPTTMVGFRKVDAMEHYRTELDALNEQIVAKRNEVTSAAQRNDTFHTQESDSPSTGERDPAIETTTAFVTFTSLRAKQAAIQCELTGDPDSMAVFPAAAPKNTIWSNCAVSLPRQKMLQFVASLLWLAGVLFWSAPVSFVTAISNLNSILETLNIKAVDESSFLYGLVSGLLPVIALAVLMVLLFMAIQLAATSFIRFKSWPEVDKYALFWHTLFQFANLWLILIGGSLFNQVNKIFEGSEESSWMDILNIIANALPGASTFFVNMISVASFGSFGLELSMIPVFFTKMVMGMLSPEESRTQRQLDDAKTPPSVVWGKQVPPTIFIFLVIFLYMPIVPLMEVFGLLYFGGMYVVWKHQFLHVYAQEFEGGGDATWQQVFGFLMACLYTGEGVFIAYMGIKQAGTLAALGFVPLAGTVLTHRLLIRKLIVPTRNLSLEMAATIDLQDGELARDERCPYRQPVLDPAEDESEPLPYRRDGNNSALGGQEAPGDLATKATDVDA